MPPESTKPLGDKTSMPTPCAPRILEEYRLDQWEVEVSTYAAADSVEVLTVIVTFRRDPDGKHPEDKTKWERIEVYTKWDGCTEVELSDKIHTCDSPSEWSDMFLEVERLRQKHIGSACL